jgi:hypothetical protein
MAETNPVPRREPRGRSADGLNDACAVMTQHTPFRRADVGPQTAEERIRWIHASCDKPHQDLRACRVPRQVPRKILQHVRAASRAQQAIDGEPALREMIAPGVLAVLAPILVGTIFGKAAVGGLLAGATAAGVMMALFMANAGGAWDNAKKYIEAGHLGGKGSDTHKAAVTGDTVGDPFKDTAGPSINILMKLMTIASLIALPLFK